MHYILAEPQSLAIDAVLATKSFKELYDQGRLVRNVPEHPKEPRQEALLVSDILNELGKAFQNGIPNISHWENATLPKVIS